MPPGAERSARLAQRTFLTSWSYGRHHLNRSDSVQGRKLLTYGGASRIIRLREPPVAVAGTVQRLVSAERATRPRNSQGTTYVRRLYTARSEMDNVIHIEQTGSHGKNELHT